MEVVLEFLGITLVVALVCSATQADEPREIVTRTTRFFGAAAGIVVVLAGLVAFFSNR